MLDIQKTIDIISSTMRNTRSDYHITLQELIEYLKLAPQELLVIISSTNDPVGEAMSYRGYYSDLSFDYGSEPITVSTFLQICKDSLNKTFEGYKGGDFVMDAETPLWIANYSGTGKVVSIIQWANGIILYLYQKYRKYLW